MQHITKKATTTAIEIVGWADGVKALEYTSGDRAKSAAVYQDLLVLSKNADPHIPIPKQAKAEYAELR